MTNPKNDIYLRWRLRSYVDSRGRLETSQWFEAVRSKGKARVLRKLEYLVDQPRSEWTRPRFDLLHGTASGLGEIILEKVDGVQTRLIGFFDDARGIFNIVVVKKKKGKQYDPKDWVEIALRRKKEIKVNPERAYDWSP